MNINRNTHPETCDPLLMEQYLADALDAAQEAAFQNHLETCSACRRLIQWAAAEPSTWSDAEEFLQDLPFDAESFGSSASDSQNDPDEGHCCRSSASAEVAQVLAMLNPTDDPQMLGRLGNYEVSGVVGSGGMGIVLKAFDGPLDRTVAIKVLAPRLASSGSARRRFAREAKAAATVLHPNVIVIHGVSNEGALPFLVMPYLRGESLQRRLDRQGPLPPEEIVRIAQQVAAGLAAAHEQGLVHRDIKPANILMEEGVERVTLTDFGLARAVDDASMTRSGVIAGTPQYMSPEQARGDNIDARSDLFSLGSVMYAMSTGRPPFRAETSYGILRRITDTEPRPIREINPNVPQWLERIIQRLLAKSLEDRIPSSEYLAGLLQNCLAHLQQPTIVELPEECRVPVRRQFGWTARLASSRTVALVAAVVIGCAGLFAVSRSMFEAGDPGAVREASAVSSEAIRLKDTASMTEWDGIQTEIEAFERELSLSEMDAGKPWRTTAEVKPP